MGQHATEIVGYSYAADIYCPEHILMAMGESDAPVSSVVAVENVLEELATSRGIDHEDETTYDSDEFPKVIFASEAWDMAGQGFPLDCATCGRPLVEG